MTLFMRRAMFAVAFSTVALAVPAGAATVVAPGAYATSDAPAAQFAVLGNISNSPATFQFVVAASELAGISAGAQISAIGFRFAGSPFTDPQGAATFSRYDIQIGRATNAPSSLSTSFAANTGSDTILARSGAMTIPAGTFTDLAGDGPNPFFDLAFATPYLYAGGDLAVTIRYVVASGSPGIAVDAFAPDARINTLASVGNANATTGDRGLNAPVTRFTFTPSAAVPEPATWALMLVGFGLMGAALRRRRVRWVAAA